jgi:hypothetical protein
MLGAQQCAFFLFPANESLRCLLTSMLIGGKAGM